MRIQGLAGIILVVGSIIFLVAAFLPISRVFAEPDPDTRLEIIENERTAWAVAQILFASGSIVTAIGLAITAVRFKNAQQVWLLYPAALLALIGACLWSWYVYQRGVEPAAFTHGVLPAWQFMAYTLLTQLGLAGFGVFFLFQPELVNWAGWLLVVGMAGLFVIFLLVKDMPPFVYYILTLLAGIIVYRVP